MTGTPRLLIPALHSVYQRLTPFTEPLIRIVAGLSLAAHGYPKLFGHTAAVADFLAEAGFEPGMLWAIALGLTEFVGGLCLAVGLLTRLVAVPILVFLVTAVAYHRRFGFYWDIRGFEYPLFWAIVVLNFLVRGGGRWSIDSLLGREV
ncbi:MAG: DoxX family protein [Xanthobacteraceae bacterium]|jgi:putative oxidoreductase